jgi:23S rRNA (cytosine1962-C5)-methyltransferase
MSAVILQPGRDRSVRRRHPWLLSGSIARLDGAADAGDVVRVLSAEGETLGFGHLSPHSNLRVRVFQFGKEEPRPEWLANRIRAVVERRRDHPLIGDTDAVRLVNAEGDGLPGLVVDRYADCVVVKLTAPGMARERETVVRALREATAAASGFERSDTSARREGFAAKSGVLWGEAPASPIEIAERDRCYQVDVCAGQKTGFYVDQRDARDLVQQLAAGCRMLDLFSYTGGFAVAAARGGAEAMTLVDSSEAALGLAEENLDRNGAGSKARIMREDAFGFLRKDDARYDLLVVDPPSLARARRDVAKASRAYKDLALFALKRSEPGARLLLFACSHHVGPDLFRKIVFGAALDAERPVRVLRTLGAGADHPVSLDHPEGAYLNGLLLEA